MHVANNTCNKTLLSKLLPLKIRPLLYLEFTLNSNCGDKILGTFLVILTLTIQEDAATLSPFFKAAVSFTINIPIWDNSCLVRTTLFC